MSKDEIQERTKGTQVLDRAVGILKHLSGLKGRGAKSVELADALNLTPQTAHRIITALEGHGLIEREPSSKQYRLGLALFRLGAEAVDGTGMRAICQPSLLRLAGETRDMVFLMGRSGADCICLDRQNGDYIIDSLTGRIGGHIPLGVGPASQAILAFLEPRMQTEILDANAERYPMFNRLDRESVASRLPTIRKAGYAIDRGELVEGIGALAMPIRPPNRAVVGAVAVNMTSARLSDARVPELIAMLNREIAAIEQRINPIDEIVASRL